MKLNRRKFLLSLGLAATLGLPASEVLADAKWPTKPVTVLVPFAPGGAVDYIARQLTTRWAEETGSQFVVVNRPGAVGAIAAAELARAAPDGYTVMFALDSHVTGEIVNPGTPYDTFKDFEYISQLVTLPQVIVTPVSRPFESLNDLVAAAKKKELVYGINGIASTAHQNVVYLQQNQDLNLTYAAYRGAGPMSLDVIGGHVDFASGGLSVMLPHIKEGTMRALAVSSLERSPLLPEIPAISELVPGHNVQSWIGLVTPSGIPDSLRTRLYELSKASVENPDLRKTLEEQSFSIVANTPDEFMEIVRRDFTGMQKLVESGAIKVE